MKLGEPYLKEKITFIRLSRRPYYDKDVLLNTDRIWKVVSSHDGKQSTIHTSQEDINGLLVAHSLEEIEKMLNPPNLMTKMGVETYGL